MSIGLPYALGCPRCPAEFIVSAADPDATLCEVAGHLGFGCPGVDAAPTVGEVERLMAQLLEIPDMEVSRR